LTQLYLLARLRGHADPAEMLAKLVPSAVPSPDGGEAPATAEAGRALAMKQTMRIESDVVPMLRKVGIV